MVSRGQNKYYRKLDKNEKYMEDNWEILIRLERLWGR